MLKVIGVVWHRPFYCRSSPAPYYNTLQHITLTERSSLADLSIAKLWVWWISACFSQGQHGNDPTNEWLVVSSIIITRWKWFWPFFSGPCDLTMAFCHPVWVKSCQRSDPAEQLNVQRGENLSNIFYVYSAIRCDTYASCALQTPETMIIKRGLFCWITQVRDVIFATTVLKSLTWRIIRSSLTKTMWQCTVLCLTKRVAVFHSWQIIKEYCSDTATATARPDGTNCCVVRRDDGSIDRTKNQLPACCVINPYWCQPWSRFQEVRGAWWIGDQSARSLYFTLSVPEYNKLRLDGIFTSTMNLMLQI